MQIASLFASIGADTSGLQKGLKDSENAIKKTAQGIEKSGESFNFAAMATGFNQTLEIVNKIGNAISKAYAAAKEGAAMEYAAVKFDNLSRSIGTTSSALLMDLRSAVKGTMSDMELMAGASDMLALGLAKSHDQAVRLTAVAGALGWNMDQLTQTITNETTMRLDSLGLSLESVKGRYEALKAAGIDGQQAMTQALIEAGEAMVNLQGHIGDTALGAFQKMEASQANFFAMLKVDLAEGMTWWAEFWDSAYQGMITGMDNAASKNIAYELGWTPDKMMPGTLPKDKQLPWHSMFWPETWKVGYGRGSGEEAWWEDPKTLQSANELRIALEGLTDYAHEQVGKNIDWDKWFNSSAYRQSFKEQVEGWNNIGAAVERARKAVEKTGATYDAYEDQQEAVVRQYDQWREELHRTAEALRTDLADAYIQVSIAEQGWREGVSGDLAGRLADDYKNSKISLDKYKESLGTLDKVYGTSHLAQLEFSLGLDELYKKLKDDPEGFAEAAKAFEAMFMPLDSAVQASMGLVGNLQAQLSALERTYNAKVNIVISTTGSLPIGGGGGSNLPQFAHAMGGYELAGQPYIVGEAGPELFIPDTNGRVYSNSSSSAMLGGGNGDLLAALGRLPTASDIALAVRDALLMVGA